MPQLKRFMVQLASNELKEKIAHFKTELPSNLFHADADLLARHYRLNRSYLSRLADWYAKRAWWQNMLVAVGLLGIIGLSTAALYLIAAITVVTLIGVILLTLALYIGVVTLLANHATMEAKRFETISTEVKRMEANLQTTIQSFQFIEERLATMLHELNEQQGLLDNYAEELEGYVEQLNEELAVAKNSIETLNQVVETIQHDTTSQKSVEQALTAQLQTLQEVIVTDTAKVCEISNQLKGNSSVLSEMEVLLKSINQTLIICDNTFKAKLDTLEEQIKTTEGEAEQLNKAEEGIKETLVQSQTLCQKVSHQIQQSLAHDLEDQAFLAQLEPMPLHASYNI